MNVGFRKERYKAAHCSNLGHTSILQREKCVECASYIRNNTVFPLEFLLYLPQFNKNKSRVMRLPLYVCVCVSPYYLLYA
jgi:hypothetical protein